MCVCVRVCVRDQSWSMEKLTHKNTLIHSNISNILHKTKFKLTNKLENEFSTLWIFEVHSLFKCSSVNLWMHVCVCIGRYANKFGYISCAYFSFFSFVQFIFHIIGCVFLLDILNKHRGHTIIENYTAFKIAYWLNIKLKLLISIFEINSVQNLIFYFFWGEFSLNTHAYTHS